MKEKKLVLAIIAIVALIILSANTVFAETGNLIVIQGNNTTAAQNNVVANNVVNNVNNVANNNVTSIVNTNTNTNTNKTTSVYNNTTSLPKTGANDYAVFLIIAICAVSAVYAYKKIRDYNI